MYLFYYIDHFPCTLYENKFNFNALLHHGSYALCSHTSVVLGELLFTHPTLDSNWDYVLFLVPVTS